MGILPYATVPYSNLTYSLAVCLAQTGNALGGFLLLFVYVTSRKLLMLLYSMATISIVYVIVLGTLSPDLPLRENFFGHILVVSIDHLEQGSSAALFQVIYTYRNTYT